MIGEGRTGPVGQGHCNTAEASLLDERLHKLPIPGVAACAGNQDEAASMHAFNSAVGVQRPVTQLPR
jgi:hypothetical protein